MELEFTQIFMHHLITAALSFIVGFSLRGVIEEGRRRK